MIRSTFLLLALILFLPLAAAAQQETASPRVLTSAQYSAKVERQDITGNVGEPVYITVTMDPPRAPLGSYVSTLAQVVDAPAKPAILPGYPKIKVTCSEPGDYTLMVKLTLVTKSSCGGVEPKTVMEQPVTLHIR